MRGRVERQAKMLMGVTTEDFIPASTHLDKFAIDRLGADGWT